MQKNNLVYIIVGYVVYTSGMNDTDRASYMEANANSPEFRKSINDGVVEIKDLKTGDRIGFYEVRPNGGVYTQSAFKEWKEKTWLAFDKNGGNGKDEWMTIESISTIEKETPNGAPLPGV